MVDRVITASVTPLGIAYIASNLESQGHKVKIVDANAEDLSAKEIMMRITGFKPNIVGFSIHGFSSHLCGLIASEIKKFDSSIITVAGGLIPTCLPQKILEFFPVFDYVIRGEGEFVFLSLVESFKNNGDLNKVLGLAYRDDKKKNVLTQNQECISPLDILPFPARHLLPVHLYGFYMKRETSIIISRGCSRSCNFCLNRNMFGSKVRRRNCERIVDELEECYEKYSIRNFRFVDSTFGDDKNFVYFLIEEIIKRKLNKVLSWQCNTRADVVSEEFLGRIREGGCRQIGFGVESGSQEALDFYKKEIKIKQIENAFRMAKKFKLISVAFIILNQYGDIKTIKQTQRFIRRLKADWLKASLLVILPETGLYYKLLNEGHLLNKGVQQNYATFFKGEHIASRYFSQNSVKRIVKITYLLFFFRIGFFTGLLRAISRRLLKSLKGYK